jgi:hypothetical protein
MSASSASDENTRSRIASLDALVTYRHPGVVARYVKDFGGDHSAAEELFIELMRWLYFCARATEPGTPDLRVSMYPEILRIDDMWYVFILHTRDYADFCARYFGRFIHHDPAPMDPSRKRGEDEMNAELEGFLSFLYDELGETTVRRWFVEGRLAKGAGPSA